jgi:predicted enzyme related to lactoylglutathione lyase
MSGERSVLIFRGINVVSLPVTDLGVARVFYSETLGLGDPVYDLPEVGWVEFSTGGPGGNLAVTLTEEGVGVDSVTPVLQVDDCYSAVAWLRAKGVECDEPQTLPGAVTFSGFRDPFGNRIQMCSDAPEEGNEQRPHGSSQGSKP